MRVAVILVWRPKNHPEWNGRTPNDGVARSLAYDTTAAPYTAIHLASLLPRDWEITVVNEMVRDVDIDMDVDAVLMSTLNFCAPHARHLAREFRARGVKVVVGGFGAHEE